MTGFKYVYLAQIFFNIRAKRYPTLFYLIIMFKLHRNNAHGWIWEYKPPYSLSKEW